jgi:hypothetical protein
MKTRMQCPARGLALVCSFAGAFFVPASHAEREMFRIDNPAYQAECASCHIAYPPQLLPGASWRTLMSDLANHFGSDASVDVETAKAIQSYLEANAGAAHGASGKAPLRITGTRWFRHEHDEVPAGTWKHPAVKSASNCGACHTQAERGDFSERGLRVPR